MGSHPLVSVIMPVYKTEPFIAQTIQSVARQTYDAIELICVNDGTPDAAFDICAEFQKQHPWIRLVDNGENRGLEYTRNHGLDEARGEYVLFLDSDDILVPEALERLVKSAEENRADMVMSGYAMLYEDKEVPVLFSPLVKEYMTTQVFSQLVLEVVPWNLVSCIGTKLYRRSLIEDSKLRFDKKYQYNEDAAFIIGCLLVGERIACVNEPLYKYRIRQSGSIMSSYRPRMFESLVKLNELVRHFFEKNGIFEQKKPWYYRKLFFLVVDSLRNEAVFGGKQSFRKTVNTVTQYADYADMIKVLSKSPVLGRKQKCALVLLRLKWYGAVYYLMK